MVTFPSSPSRSSLTALHQTFLQLLPRLHTHAEIAFRYLPCPDQRRDRMAEVGALAWKWLRRLEERGKDIHQFPTVFVSLVVKAVRSGRTVAGQERTRDILSRVAQVRHHFRVESLQTLTAPVVCPSQQGGMRHVVRESLQDNTTTPIPDQVAFRQDWPRFFQSLPVRDQGMVEFLAQGHRPEAVAVRFGVSQARVSQLRKRWHRLWQAFQGEGPELQGR